MDLIEQSEATGGKEHARKPNALTWVMYFIIALPVLYLLSTGPMFFVLEKYFASEMAEPWTNTFFTPYAWLCDNTPLEKPLEAYTNWWMSQEIPK